jgi:hypothetical protein
MCVNCGVQGCGCNPSQIQIPIGPQGPTGMTGPIGPPGQNGTNGRSIIDSNYNPNTGVVTFYYSDNTTSVTGDLRGADGSGGSGGGSSAGSDIINEFTSNTFEEYNDFIDSSLAQWRAQMHPTGVISMFAASTANFANGYGIDLPGGSNLLGWAICNGNPYTKSITGSAGGNTVLSPNLTGKFVVGVDGITFTVGSQGGSATHQHNIDPLSTNQIPKHRHGVNGVTIAMEAHSHGSGTLAAASAGSHSHEVLHDATFDGAGRRTIDLQNNATDLGYTSKNSDNNLYIKENGAHTHTISGSTESKSVNGTLAGLTDENTSTQAGITTQNANNLPPYYSIIYLIKI